MAARSMPTKLILHIWSERVLFATVQKTISQFKLLKENIENDMRIATISFYKIEFVKKVKQFMSQFITKDKDKSVANEAFTILHWISIKYGYRAY